MKQNKLRKLMCILLMAAMALALLSFAAPADATAAEKGGDAPPVYSAQLDNPFADVKSGDWFYDSAMFAYYSGMMAGTSATPILFSPNMATTRGMVVTVLYRHAGSPDVSDLDNPFADVPVGQYYADAIKWAAANEIISAFDLPNRQADSSRFRPNDHITRQDMVIYLNNYAIYADMELHSTRSFQGFADDADIGAHAKEAIELFFEASIIDGKPGNIFDPGGSATRAEFSTLLTNLLEEKVSPYVLRLMNFVGVSETYELSKEGVVRESNSPEDTETPQVSAEGGDEEEIVDAPDSGFFDPPVALLYGESPGDVTVNIMRTYTLDEDTVTRDVGYILLRVHADLRISALHENVQDIRYRPLAYPKPDTTSFLVDGEAVHFECYEIFGYEFFALTDFAKALSGTEKQFGISFDDISKSVTIRSSDPHTSGEDATAQRERRSHIAELIESKIYLDEDELELWAYRLDGAVFVRFHEFMEALGVYFEYDDDFLGYSIDTSMAVEESVEFDDASIMSTFRPMNSIAGTWYSNETELRMLVIHEGYEYARYEMYSLSDEQATLLTESGYMKFEGDLTIVLSNNDDLGRFAGSSRLKTTLSGDIIKDGDATFSRGAAN